MMCKGTIFKAGLLVAIAAVLLIAPTTFAKGNQGDEDNRNRVIVVNAQPADDAQVGFFNAFWSWFTGDSRATINRNYPVKDISGNGPFRRRQCGGENGCIMVTDKP